MINRLARNQLWIWIGIIVIAFIVVSLLVPNNQPKQYPPYVSHSPSPTGTKALYTYLNESDYTVKQWKHEPSLLINEGNHQLLLMIEPLFVPSHEELMAYEQFMERGNTILLFSDSPTRLFNIKTTYSIDFFEAEEGLTYRDESYDLHIDRFEQLVTKDEDKVLLYDDAGAYAFERPYGNGSLIVVNAGGILMNERVIDADHAELFLSFIEDFSFDEKSILFDEFVHDREFATSFIASYPFWFLVLLFQGAVIALVWLFYKGKRFGPIFTPREDYVRFSDEGLVALASWYMRGKRYQDSLNIQADYVKQLLYDEWGIPYQLSWQDSKQLLERRWKFPPKNIGEFVNELETILSSESINKGQYVQWSKLLDELRKEVEEG